jgi:hypothetical protein
MKASIQSIISSGLVVSALAFGITTSSTRAVAQSETLATANIPFSFQVGETLLPAGNYTFSRQLSRVIKLQDSHGDRTIFTVVRLDTKARPTRDGSIVFARYGNHYFLRQLDVPGSRSSFKYLQTRQETSIAHQAGGNNGNLVAVNNLASSR